MKLIVLKDLQDGVGYNSIPSGSTTPYENGVIIDYPHDNDNINLRSLLMHLVNVRSCTYTFKCWFF